MFDELPFTEVIQFILKVCLFCRFALLLRRPLIHEAKHQLITSPIDVDLIVIVVIGAF